MVHYELNVNIAYMIFNICNSFWLLQSRQDETCSENFCKFSISGKDNLNGF